MRTALKILATLATVVILSCGGCVCLGAVAPLMMTPEQRAAWEAEQAVERGNRAARETIRIANAPAKARADQAKAKEAAAAKVRAAAAAERAVDAAMIRITARQLMAEYEANEVAADIRYRGKRLRVEGWVSEIDKGMLDGIYVAINDRKSYSDVRADLGPMFETVVAGLQKGQHIWIEGKCTGLSIGDVRLTDATLKFQ